MNVQGYYQLEQQYTPTTTGTAAAVANYPGPASAHPGQHGPDTSAHHPQTIGHQQVTGGYAHGSAAGGVVGGGSGSSNSHVNAMAGSKARGEPRGFGRTSSVYLVGQDGVKRRATAEDFRSEVEERTRNGESCEQIADALIAQGAQVTAKSIGRWRIQWGFRKRAMRKQTKVARPKEQVPFTKKKLRQSQHKADITELSEQGLPPEEVAREMSARGMVLKKGASTIVRLQTAWGLRGSEDTRLRNRQYVARRKARQQQMEEFYDYARELNLDDPDDWVRRKMQEPTIKRLREHLVTQIMTELGDSADGTSGGGQFSSDGRPGAASPAATDGPSTDGDAMDRDDLGSEEESSDQEAATIMRNSTARVLQQHNNNNNTYSQTTTSTRRMADDDSDSDDPDYEPLQVILQKDPEKHLGPRPAALAQATRMSIAAEIDRRTEQQQASHDRPSTASSDPHGLRSRAAASHAFAAATTLAAKSSLDEAANLRAEMAAADECAQASQHLRDLLQARLQSIPATDSLGGAEPSTWEIQVARRKLHAAAQAVLDSAPSRPSAL
ncbi:hypothetical protein BX600DRAFT_436436 [Xylariales sp. PMI_506]|nr:hypothetical protein BX600DRAFT_436436 [Xylariales sp. PMI_506]